jgi:2-polyprenyl-6-methoxyphenol hydroxylase-like FAD-dependent oxidoreductase
MTPKNPRKAHSPILRELEQAVVIVGAGPTVLALGAELMRLGISSLILDRLEAGANTSRAAVVHARTLEVLEPLGVTPRTASGGDHRFDLSRAG